MKTRARCTSDVVEIVSEKRPRLENRTEVDTEDDLRARMEWRIRVLQAQCRRYWEQSPTLYAENLELRRCNADMMELRRELVVLQDFGHIS